MISSRELVISNDQLMELIPSLEQHLITTDYV